MNTVCTKCGSDKVFIDTPKAKEEKMPQTQTMDDLKRNATQGDTLVYYYTTYRCRECDYSVSF